MTINRPSAQRRTEIVIAGILRGGVLLSGTVIAFGVLLSLVRGLPPGVSDVTKVSYPYTPAAVFQGIGQGNPGAVIMLGLMLLIATPISRIAVSIVAFAIERDWRYVVITTIVFMILMVSFLLGKAGG